MSKILSFPLSDEKFSNTERHCPFDFPKTSKSIKMKITFSSCWYPFNGKFDFSTYFKWIDNMLKMVNNYYLVVYTNDNGMKHLERYQDNQNIKFVVKSEEDFVCYRFKEYWIKNQALLKKSKNLDWKVNMLWSEKIFFVKETVEKRYFDTEMYGWCDIGYFRGRQLDTCLKDLINWPSNNKIVSLNPDKIHYALINNNLEQHKNSKFIGEGNTSIAGGFFILHKKNIQWWMKTYDEKLRSYFKNKQLVADDQVIILSCVLENRDRFELHQENSIYDSWFMFQRILI